MINSDNKLLKLESNDKNRKRLNNLQFVCPKCSNGRIKKLLSKNKNSFMHVVKRL